MLSYYLLQKTVIYHQEAILNISNKTVLTSIQFACQSVLFSWKLGQPRWCPNQAIAGCLKIWGLFPNRSSYFMLNHPMHLGCGTHPTRYACEYCRLVSLSGVGTKRASIIVNQFACLPYDLHFSTLERKISNVCHHPKLGCTALKGATRSTLTGG